MHHARLCQAFLGCQCSFLVFAPGNAAWHKSCGEGAGSGTLSTSVVWCEPGGRSTPNGREIAPQSHGPLSIFQIMQGAFLVVKY